MVQAVKGIIYYSDSRLGEPICSTVQALLRESGLPIVSVTRKPLALGENLVVKGDPSYLTMVRQIVTALGASRADYVFFCEHDVLYPAQHFTFTPAVDNVWYYDANVWRWWFGSDRAIRYQQLLPLSCLCVNRQWAKQHFGARLLEMLRRPLDFQTREPAQARTWGYEPGTKKRRRGGFSDDAYEVWRAEVPVIDIRHPGTLSPAKISLESFKHQPAGWEEIPIEQIPGWDLRARFGL